MIPTILIGTSLAGGLALVLAWARSRTLTLSMRIEPHLRAPGEVERAGAQGSWQRMLGPVLRDGVRALERWGTSSGEVARRLRRAGSPQSVDQYRASQVLWGVAGLVAGLAGAAGLLAWRSSSPVALTVFTLVCGVVGLLGREQALSRRIAQREARLLAELPTIAELLALSVSAGEGALGALERVSRTASGALAGEIRDVVAATRAGVPLAEALHGLADSSELPALRRFVDTIAAAVERGTPLADVLRAQADDVRVAGRQQLMEEGGRREILMMIPVVFLILPVTVIFAVFPGAIAINLGF